MELLATVFIAVWVMLPAYVPNNVAVLAGGGRPIDGGRTWRGNRVLGDGKTWRGTVAGVLAGVALAAMLIAGTDPIGAAIGVDLPAFTVGIAIAFPVGALLGDMAASFLKRRTGRDRGAPFPLVDQLDFLVVALLAGMVADPGWMVETFDLLLLVVVLILTPVLHVTTNGIAYVTGLKAEPW